MSDNRVQSRRQASIIVLNLLFAAVLIAGTLAPAAAMAGQKKHHAGGQANGKPARDRQGRVQTEIVGGHPVPQGVDTFMVYILIDAGKQKQQKQRKKKPVYIQCGGTLIDMTHVLTAAHCVAGNQKTPQKFHLAIGQANIRSFKPGAGRPVAEVVLHPAYNPVTFANDVAVLRLTEAVDDEGIEPITIVGPGQTEFDEAGKPASVVGWGQISEQGPAPAQLRAADLRIASDQACGKAYRSGFDARVMICASYRHRDSCYGDSGGPLIAREQVGTRTVTKHRKHQRNGKRHHRQMGRQTKQVPVYENLSQIGIVSWGRGCAERGSPGVYTRLSDPGINAFIMDALSR
ncbi:MAG: serine protease [Thermomicrobiales bacterium]|nr:serine protease [Thermomicrobiales bacterium]